MGKPNSSVEHKYYCGDCGKELTFNEKEKSCPKCGSMKRNVHVFVTEKITVQESIGVKVRDLKGKFKSKLYIRNKVSNHGNAAKEELRIDIEGNRKFHRVQEQNKDGTWNTVHREDVPLKKNSEKQTNDK
jgi:DNA-directed RNA polymerase subunit RPC12/RpoP